LVLYGDSGIDLLLGSFNDDDDDEFTTVNDFVGASLCDDNDQSVDDA
jgi:hypothetical protein